MPFLALTLPEHPALSQAGLRFGARGTHTSRTMMLSEVEELLAAVPPKAGRQTYAEAVIEENVLGKATTSTRRLTHQRLGELYAFDPKVAIFRVLRRVWAVDRVGHPRIALLAALARDPLLRYSAGIVLALRPGAELIRGELIRALRSGTGARLNEATLDKVARNVASTWCQGGFLEGRVRKIRHLVEPSPGALAFALWLGSHEGLAGESLLACRWTQVLDRTGPELVPTLLEAKRLGLLEARVGGGVVDIDLSALDPGIGGPARG